MAGQLLERRLGVLRSRDLNEFDLFELVLADHAARVLAVGPRLAPETRGLRGVAQRQLVGVEDLAGDHVGHRHLGGRDQVTRRIVGGGEGVFAELRQLAGTGHRLRVDKVRQVELGVAVLAGVHVQHELRQRAVQARQRAAQHGEARAGQLRGGLGVEQAVRVAQFDVLARLEVEFGRLPPAAHLDVVVLVPADRHAGQRHVRHVHLPGLLPRLDLGELGLGLRQLLAEVFDLVEQRLDVLAAGLGLPDRFRAGVLAVLQVLGAQLQVLAAGVEFAPGRRVEVVAAAGQGGGDGLGVVSQELGIEHGRVLR